MPKSESGLHRSYQRRRTVSSSSATDQENALADIDEAESSEGAHSDQRNIRQLYDRVQQCPELSRSREGISAPDPHSVCSPSRYREGFVRDITLSAVARAAKDSSSPLDQLVEDVTALSQTQWAASLPSRPRGRNDRLVRFPTFLDDDEVANTPTSQERLSASSSHTSHAYGQPQRSPGATINQPARHDLSIQPMAAGPAPVVTSGPRTPTLVGSAADGRTHTRSQMTNQRGSAIRRRPVPGAEQENEDELAPYLAERRAWLARQNEPYRGRLNRTPSPSGHLGRRLS